MIVQDIFFWATLAAAQLVLAVVLSKLVLRRLLSTASNDRKFKRSQTGLGSPPAPDA